MGRTPAQDVALVKRDQIHLRASFNHREITDLDELVESIRQHGILQSVLVKKRPQGDYHLVAGHRRLAAADVLGIKVLPCTILDDMTDEEMASFAENSQRRKVRSYDQAVRFRHWRDERGFTPLEISRRAGVSLAWVTDHLFLLDNLTEDLIGVWRRNESTQLFNELMWIAKYPKEEQEKQYEKSRDVKARIAATRSSNPSVSSRLTRRKTGHGRAKEVAVIYDLLNRRMKTAQLTAKEKDLVVGTLEWSLGLRSHLPFTIARGFSRKKDEEF